MNYTKIYFTNNQVLDSAKNIPFRYIACYVHNEFKEEVVFAYQYNGPTLRFKSLHDKDLICNDGDYLAIPAHINKKYRNEYFLTFCENKIYPIAKEEFQSEYLKVKS